MPENRELNLIGRIQCLLINLGEKGSQASTHMLWMLLGLIEAGFLSGFLTEAEYAEYQRLVGEMLADAGEAA